MIYTRVCQNTNASSLILHSSCNTILAATNADNVAAAAAAAAAVYAGVAG